MNIPHEEDFVGRGVSYCATCDGNFYKGKTVAVIGGGNSALASALYLSDLAEKVYLVHRRNEYRASEFLQQKVTEKSNIEPILGYIPSELITDGKKLTGLKLTKNPDLATAPGSHFTTLFLSGIFVAIGKIPSNDLVAPLVDLDESGYIKTDEVCKTKTPGLFAAGDCRVKSLRQLVTATSDGALSATSALDFLSNQ